MEMRKNKGIVTLTLLGVVIAVGILLVFGWLIAFAVTTGLCGGSIASCLCSGLRRYHGQYIDVRDTD